MSEDAPDADNQPPGLGAEDVPSDLEPSETETETASAESENRRARIKRAAKVAGKVARSGYVAFNERVVDKASFGKLGPIAERRKAQDFLPEDEITETVDEPEEIIEEDTEETWAESSDPEDPVSNYLRGVGVDEAKINEVRRVLNSSLSELVHLYLSNLGIATEQIAEAANLLVPHQLYLKKLQELGMPEDSNDAAHKILVDEAGRLRLKHLVELVGGDKEVEIRKLMSTRHQNLLAEEFKELGFDDKKIKEISATPRRNRGRLVQEALRKLGIENETIQGIELTAAIVEIPPDIAEAAGRLEIPLETLVKAREAFKRADWKDTFDYLELARTDEGVREQLKPHGIEIEPAPETESEKKERLRTLTLKKINATEPGEWEAERARRMAMKKEELAIMLEDFKDYLPLKDLPLPDDVEVPPDVRVPKYPGREDPNYDNPKYIQHQIMGAYGLWKRLLIDSYAKRIGDNSTYKDVRSELHRIGGRVPLLRKIRQRQLAIGILREQKKQAREAGAGGNFGALGFGYTKYKQIFRSVEDADIKVQDALRALDRFHKSNFVSDGQDTPRKRLAEQIVAARLREIAIHEGRLDPIQPHLDGVSAEVVSDDQGMV